MWKPSLNKKIFTLEKCLRLFSLFLVPAMVSVYWYKVSYEEFHPFVNLETGGAGDISDVKKLADSFYEFTKDKSSVQFNRGEENNSDVGIFNIKVSEGIIEKLGVFSSLPYHKVCLNNRNEIFVDGILDNTQHPDIGAVAINQKDGYNFYAKRGGKDCKSVLIEKFRQSSSSPELGYAFTQRINSEENQKRLNGEDYSYDIATTTVKAMNTTIVISLLWWAVLLGYALILFTWSFIFFQYVKIFEYFSNVWNESDSIESKQLRSRIIHCKFHKNRKRFIKDDMNM